MPEFSGVHHIALSVTDLSVSVPFYEKLFGVPPVAILPSPTFVRHVFRPIPTMSVGLTQHDAHHDGPFSPLQPGLDHVGFGCADRAAVVQWAEHLESVGIAHSGVIDDGPATVLSFKDPDDIALEFYVTSGASGV